MIYGAFSDLRRAWADHVLRTIGAWDFTPNPVLYKMYTELLPRVMDIMRARGKAKTRKNLGS